MWVFHLPVTILCMIFIYLYKTGTILYTLFIHCPFFFLPFSLLFYFSLSLSFFLLTFPLPLILLPIPQSRIELRVFTLSYIPNSFIFWDKALLSCPDYMAGLEFITLLSQLPRVLGLQVYITMPDLTAFFTWYYITISSSTSLNIF